jgi:STE24 endopeptidase
MVRKWTFFSIGGYLLFVLVMYAYIFHWANTSIPQWYEGTSADPATFLNDRELMLSEKYSAIRNFLFFLATPFEWFIYFFLIIWGFSRKFEEWGKKTSRLSFVQTAVYLFWFYLVATVITLPLNYISYYYSVQYGITTQTFSLWMKDQLIDFWVNYVIMYIVVLVLYWLMARFQQRWWLVAWILSIPFTLFLMFIQPVMIDPLYNDFYPLQNKELEKKILTLAEEAGIPAKHVYEVNMAEKTNALNAYVTGIGSNSRIVLWDTTLNQLSEDEILFVMAHEMAHYVEKHIYFGIAVYLLLSFVGLWLTAKWMRAFITKYGKTFHLEHVHQLRTLPLFFLFTSMLLFAVSPLSNAVSRYEETRADKYAIELTENKEAAIGTFQELTKASLSQVHPPFFVKLFRYSHPSMLDRIMMIETYPIEDDEE